MAAEDVVGSLAVKLALQSGSFDAGMKRVGTELKAIDSGFRASAAEAAAAGQKYDTLGQKQTALSQKLEVQQTALTAYREKLDQLRAKMGSLSEAQAGLKDKVSAAKTAWEQAKNELEAHRKAGDLTEEETKRLSDRVKELGTEYKTLTTQQKQVDVNMSTLQGTISRTEASYNDLRTQTAKTRQELNRTEAEIKKQSSAWEKLKTAAEKSQKGLEKAGKTLNSVGNKLSIGITAPITAGLYEAGDAAMDFEDQLAKIGTMPGVTKASLKSIGDDLVQISNDTNTAVGDMAEAEYQALSAGVAVAQSTDYMSVSAKAAKGGFTDLTTAVDGSTSVLNAWGLEAGAATDVYNKMIVAQNFGKTTLGELAGSIGQVASTAAGLKISYTEVLAASATMTKGGIATSQSMSMLNQVLANVLKPSAEAKKTAKALGLEFDATAIKTKGLAGFLKDIETKAGGNETALAKLFGSVEAYKAVAALAGTQSEDFAAALGEMEKSAGAVDSAFNTVSDTTGNKARAALNRLKNEALQFGNVMLPTVNSLLDKFDGIVSGLESMDENTRRNTLIGAGAVALIGPTIKSLGGVASGLAGISKLLTGAKAAGGIASALGLVGLPLAAGAAGIGLLALTTKIIQMNSESAKVKDRIMKVSLDLDDQSQADFDAKVNDVTINTKKVMDIQLKVDAEKTDIAGELEDAIGDGKMTKGETNKLRKDIDAWVDDAIAGVKTDTATKAAEIATALDQIAGLSPETKTKIVEATKEKGDQQINELQGYQAELNTLLASMKGGTEALTADKIARFNELLGLIATMKTQIEEANAGLSDYYTAQTNYLKTGNGTPEQAQANVKLGVQIATSDYETAQKVRQEQIATLQKALDTEQSKEGGGDADVVTELKGQIELKFGEQTTAEKEYQDKLTQILNDGATAALSGVQNGDNRLSALLTNYMQLGFLDADPKAVMDQLGNDSSFRQKYTDAINQVLGSAYSPDQMNTKTPDGLNTWLSASESAINQLKTSITSEMETGDFNPVVEMLKNSMDGLDLSGIDTGKLSEGVKGLFALVDFDKNDGEVSKDIWQGLANGLGDNYSIAEDQMSTCATSLIQKVKDQFGIQSPSTVMKDVGMYLMEGLRDGIQLNAGMAQEPFQTLVDTDFPNIGTGMMDALILAINNKAEAFKTAVVDSVSKAITAAQLKANAGVKIPVSLIYTNASLAHLSQALGLGG